MLRNYVVLPVRSLWRRYAVGNTPLFAEVSNIRMGTRNSQIRNHSIIPYPSPPVAPQSDPCPHECKFLILHLCSFTRVLRYRCRWAEITPSSSLQAPCATDSCLPRLPPRTAVAQLHGFAGRCETLADTPAWHSLALIPWFLSTMLELRSPSAAPVTAAR
jgi:hypothetical protein